MKTIKSILAVILALSMLLALCACGKDNSDSGMANYQVKVLDGQGKPLTSGVIVKFLQNGEQVAMQLVNTEGIAAKELTKGDYTVELTFTNNEISGHYDQSAAVLSADKTTLELSLISKLGDATYDLVADGEDHKAYVVTAGSTYVPVKAGIRTYFVFTPAEAGTYQFSVDHADVKLNYYGTPHFVHLVQDQNATDDIDNAVTLSVSAGSLGASYVIGLDGTDADVEAVLSIIRTGDPALTFDDLPWTVYKTTHTPAPYTLSIPSGKSLKYVDIKGKTEDNKIVFNDTDGYYHFGTADGPIVLMHLGKKAPYVSLQTVIEGDGLGGGTSIRKYFFDGKGTAPENLVKREDYTDILRTYFENMDKDAGVYPLTKDLEYIIKNGCSGWWTKDDPNFIFTDCNPEIGWMFALCYVG